MITASEITRSVIPTGGVASYKNLENCFVRVWYKNTVFYISKSKAINLISHTYLILQESNLKAWT